MPSFEIKVGGVLAPVQDLQIKVGGALVQALELWRLTGGSLVLIWSHALASATAAPATCSATGASTPLTTNATTCTTMGGSGHTYTWEFVSGNNTITPTAGSSATTAFTAAVASGQLKEAVYRCKVIAGGVTVYSNNVTIHIERT